MTTTTLHPYRLIKLTDEQMAIIAWAICSAVNTGRVSELATCDQVTLLELQERVTRPSW
jgi:hypothetical protein